MSEPIKPKSSAERLSELEDSVSLLTEEVAQLQGMVGEVRSYLIRMFSAQHTVIDALRTEFQPGRNQFANRFRDQINTLESEINEKPN